MLGVEVLTSLQVSLTPEPYLQLLNFYFEMLLNSHTVLAMIQRNMVVFFFNTVFSNGVILQSRDTIYHSKDTDADTFMT